MVWGSGCAGVAVPSVTSMRTLKGRMMSIQSDKVVILALQSQ